MLGGCIFMNEALGVTLWGLGAEQRPGICKSIKQQLTFVSFRLTSNICCHCFLCLTHFLKYTFFFLKKKQLWVCSTIEQKIQRFSKKLPHPYTQPPPLPTPPLEWSTCYYPRTYVTDTSLSLSVQTLRQGSAFYPLGGSGHLQAPYIPGGKLDALLHQLLNLTDLLLTQLFLYESIGRKKKEPIPPKRNIEVLRSHSRGPSSGHWILGRIQLCFLV